MSESTIRIFEGLSPHYRALVTCALMLDGVDAASFLATDEQLGDVLKEAVAEFFKYSLEMRLPLVGTLFRDAVEELARSSANSDL